jgi:catechol 2,3-dioxygenase-like lactoylglutathione lyase family enzyme
MKDVAENVLIKFHSSLNVTDLSRSIAFYRVLLGVEPAKVREDYAKFELEEPPLVLSLIPGRPGGNVNHAGLRVRSTEELIEAQRRLETAGIVTQREDGVECCYARQTKFWVSDPDRMLWEIYVFHEDIDERGNASVPTVSISPVDVSTKPLLTWMHRLGESFPALIPFDANTLHEVTLEGSLNARPDSLHREKLFSETFRVLRPGGTVHCHGLAGDRSGNGERPSLPGPAAAVQYVPAVSEIVRELQTSGFVEIQIETLSQKAYFVVDGISMREFRVRAKKQGHRPKPKTHYAVYRGPLAQVVDDYGNVFQRGELTALNVHDWQMLSKGESNSAFVFLEPPGTVNISPPTPVSQDRQSN